MEGPFSEDSIVELVQNDKDEIAEITSTVYDGNDYWLDCFDSWKATEHTFDDDAASKVGATFAHGLRSAQKAGISQGELIALNAVQFLNNSFCWCLALRVSPEHRGKGAGGKIFGLGLEWASKRGATSFGMSTVSINAASLAVGAKFGFKIAPEWNHYAMKRSISPASSLLEGPPIPYYTKTPSEIQGLLEQLVSLDAATDQNRSRPPLITASWAFTPITVEALKTFLDPACTAYLLEGEEPESVLIEQVERTNFMRDGPKDKDDVLELWWTLCASSLPASTRILQSSLRRLTAYRGKRQKIRITLFCPLRLLSAAADLKWSAKGKEAFLLHCLIRDGPFAK